VEGVGVRKREGRAEGQLGGERRRGRG